MKNTQTLIVSGIILLSIAATAFCPDVNSAAKNLADANRPAQPAKNTIIPPTRQSDETAKLQQESERLKTENAVLEKAVKAYEKSTSDLRWGLWGIITLSIAFIGVMVFKSTREYREALRDAKETLKEIKEIAKSAEVSAEKARKTVDGIDKTVDDKLKEIDKKADEAIAKISEKAEAERKKSQQDAEKERKISKLWSKGFRAVSEGRFEDSCKSWQEITAIKPDMYEAWSNWGYSLYEQARKEEGPEADRLFSASYVKYQKASDLDPDFYETWNNWGVALLEQAKKKEGNEADKLFAEAYIKFQKAIDIKLDNDKAWNNWGLALSEQAKKKKGPEADRLFEQSYAKFQKAIDIEPNNHDTWSNWGVVLLYQAQKKEWSEKKKLLQEAREKCLKAEQIEKGGGSYNLACVAAVEDIEDECKKWLKTAEEAGTLPTRKHAMADDDLRPYREKEWFKALKWKE